MINRRFGGTGAVAGLVILAAAQTACTTPAEPKLKTVEVHIPVATACISPKNDPGPEPAYSDDVLPEGDGKIVERTQRRFAANEERRARLAVLEPVVASCR